MPGVFSIGKTLQITASLQRVSSKYGIFDSANNYYGGNKDLNQKVNDNFRKSIFVKISEPELTARIVPDGDEIIEPSIMKELYLELLDKSGNLLERTVEWKVEESAGHLSQGKTNTGAEQITVFSADKPGTYTITAEYTVAGNKKQSVKKTITVRKPEVELIIHGDTSGYKGDSKQYWLEAKIDGKVVTDLDVVWHQNSKWETKLGTTKSNEDSKVTVQYGLYQGSPYKLLALVNIAGEEYTKIQEITLN